MGYGGCHCGIWGSPFWDMGAAIVGWDGGSIMRYGPHRALLWDGGLIVGLGPPLWDMGAAIVQRGS